MRPRSSATLRVFAKNGTGMTLDTNIIIAYLAGEQSVIDSLSAWKARGLPLYVPTVVETETLSFSKLTPSQRVDTERFFDESFISVCCDRSIARLAGKIRSTMRVHLADAVIAATALTAHTPLVTRNLRDFKNVPGLEVQTI